MFDALGRQTQEIDALNKTITYTYNAIDQLTQKKDRKTQTIDYTYDDAGRLTNQVWKNSGGTTVNRVTYTYDNAGHLLTARDTNGAYTFTYDVAGQVLTQKDMWSTTLTFTYDNVGNRTKVQDSFSGVETSTYDSANRLTSRKFGGVGGTSHRLEFTYTNADQLENIKRYNAATSGTMIGQTTFTYDNALRMAGIKNANTGGTVLSQYTYTYDAVNRLSTEELGGVTKTFSYDVRSQLTGDGTASYGYDSAGNRNNSSQTITAGNRLDLDTNWDYSYDDEGNLTGKVSVAMPTVTWTYTWDVNNRMVAAVKSAGSNLYSVDYKYDVFGNRIEQIEDVDGAGGGSSVTTRFAWEGAGVLQDAWGNRTTPVGTENWNIWADLNGSNGLVTRYVRGDEVDQLFSRVKADGTVAHYLTDRMQSTRQMLDASGTVANTITYDGFGNVLSETDAAFGDRWKWTGREYNNYTGLQYNRARYFSGESGRWVSEDQIRMSGSEGYNVSRYAGNQSINISDPNGNDWCGLPGSGPALNFPPDANDPGGPPPGLF
ncbi:MAG TPA: RHS repeat-associated core domain-containing protein, partial [Gemmatales bacterium]|nr:RHS repeat-associated core domain-containing protein [Gemmatales bacterium]